MAVHAAKALSSEATAEIRAIHHNRPSLIDRWTFIILLCSSGILVLPSVGSTNPCVLTQVAALIYATRFHRLEVFSMLPRSTDIAGLFPGINLQPVAAIFIPQLACAIKIRISILKFMDFQVLLSS
jgi:hypothetical protein